MEGKYMQQHILVDILDFNQTEKKTVWNQHKICLRHRYIFKFSQQELYCKTPDAMKSNCNTYMGTVSISDEACLKGKKCKGRRENQKKMNTGH